MTTATAGSVALPLDADRRRRVHDAVAGLGANELHWVSGYLAGLAAAEAPAAAADAAAGPALTILYGSQTGNGERVARELAAAAEARGAAATLQSLADYRPARLKQETRVTLVVSTHGDGDPPDDAELFREFLLADTAPKLDRLQFAVLALGDSSYVNFCQTGRELDARLAELGAVRLLPLAECDLDFENEATRWRDAVIDALPAAPAPQRPHLRAVESPAEPTVWTRERPFAAEVLVNQKITGSGSDKDVRHIELSLEGSGIRYEPGDALAIVAENPPRLVRELLAAFGWQADAAVAVDGESRPLGTVLARDREITATSAGFLRRWASLSASRELDATLTAGGAPLAGLLRTHQVIDVVRQYPATGDVDPADFIASLRRLAPRSYSIASSIEANPDEVHITVAAVRYEAFGSLHDGAASTFLADRVAAGDRVPVFVERNSRFRLPADDTPIIMIGPGTGVAPFRAFVEERAERNAGGDTWLIFGERRRRSDFLYQLEWQRHLKAGNLTRLDVAFSRDQAHKVYVQDRLREQAGRVWRWLERGASIYVCGDAERMAGDVHAALVEIIGQQAGIDAQAAEQRLRELRRAGRYQRDVY